jgi:hypothetical protein
MAALAGIACAVGCPQPPPDDNMQIASIQIVPQIVTAVKGTRFEIRLHAWNANHHRLPDSKAALVTWTAGPGLVFSGSDKGARVIVDAPGSGTFPLTTDLKAALGSVSDAATITIIAAGPPGTSTDWIVADHTPSEPPLIVLADGRAPEGPNKVWRGDTTIAVVGEGPLDQFLQDCNGANCGEVTMFSRKSALTSLGVKWRDVCDLVAFTSGPVPTTCRPPSVSLPSPPVTVAVRTYIAASGVGIETSVGAELAKVHEILLDFKSGLDVTAAPEVVFPVSLVLDVMGPDWKCPTSGPNDLRQQLRLANISDTTFKPSGITLVYVDELLGPATLGVESSAGRHRGYACPWDPTNGTIVLVSRLDRVSSTLLHELGHGLSGWGPQHNFGHTAAPDFDESNLMWEWQADDVPASRVDLSLGQIFRLSLETGSILNRPVGGAAQAAQPAQASGVDCRLVVGTPKACPRLAKDIRPP